MEPRSNHNLSLISLIKQRAFEKVGTILNTQENCWTVSDDKNISTETTLFEELLKCVRSNDYQTFKSWKSCVPKKYFKSLMHKTDANGNTLLHWAGYDNFKDIADILIEAGANPKQENAEGLSYYDYFRFRITYNRDKTARTIFNALIESIEKGDITKWNLLFPIDFKKLSKMLTKEGETALTLSAKLGNIDVAKALIGLGADPQKKNKNGFNYYDNLILGLAALAKKQDYQKIKIILKEYWEVFWELHNSEEMINNALFEALLSCVKSGDIEIWKQWQACIKPTVLKQLLKKQDKHKDTLLSWAAYSGHLEIAADLLALGADPRVENQYGFNYYDNLSLSIISLAKSNHYQKIKTILEHKEVRCDIRDFRGSADDALFEALLTCIKSGDTKTWKQWKACLKPGHLTHLLKKQDKSTNTLLTWAAHHRHFEIANELLALGTDPQVKNNDGLNYYDILDLTMLSFTNKKDYQKIKAILENKEVYYSGNVENILFEALLTCVQSNDLNTWKLWKAYLKPEYLNQIIQKQTEYKDTLLTWATSRNHFEIAEDLLALGANPQVKNNDGFNYYDYLSLSVITLVKQKNYQKISQILEYKEVNLNVRDSQGSAEDALFEALLTCVKSGDIETWKKWKACLKPEHLQQLIQKQDNYKDTLLTWAVYHGHLIMAEELRGLGADPQARNNGGFNYYDYLSLVMIRQKNYWQITHFLKNTDIRLDVRDAQGSAEDVLHHAILTSIKNNDDKEFVEWQTCIPHKIWRQLINKPDAEGETALSWAQIKARKDLAQLLMAFGATTSTHQFNLLTPSAFTPESDIKLDSCHSLYGKDALVSTFEVKQQNAGFKAQFSRLLMLYRDWGRAQQCETKEVKNGLSTIGENFFLPEFSGMQPPLYFELVKKNLEKIMLSLMNDHISIVKRKKAYSFLCNNLHVCGPGLFTHIEATSYDLMLTPSVERWLAEKRTSIIRFAADKHNVAKEVNAGNSIHTYMVFSKYAANEGWNPLSSIHVITDNHAIVSKVSEEDLQKFHRYFMKEYTPEAIRACLQTNLDDLLVAIFKEYGYPSYNSWNTINQDYASFTAKLETTLKALGVELMMDEYMEKNAESTQICIHTNVIINALCEKVLPHTLYFHPTEKMYRQLIPQSWVDLSQNESEDFDFSLWEHIPAKEFSSIFLKNIQLLSTQHLLTLMNQLPRMRLLDMLNTPDLMKTLSLLLKKQLENCLDIHYTNNAGQSLLHLAVLESNIPVIKMLFAAGFNPLFQDKNGHTPIDLADASLKSFIDLHMDILSLQNGIQHVGGKLNESKVTNLIKTAMHDGRCDDTLTELMFIAVKHGRDDVMAILIQHHVNFRVTNQEGETPLMLAAKKGHDAMVQRLLDAKPVLAPQKMQEELKKALHEAQQHNKTSTVAIIQRKQEMLGKKATSPIRLFEAKEEGSQRSKAIDHARPTP